MTDTTTGNLNTNTPSKFKEYGSTFAKGLLLYLLWEVCFYGLKKASNKIVDRIHVTEDGNKDWTHFWMNYGVFCVLALSGLSILARAYFQKKPRSAQGSYSVYVEKQEGATI